MLEEFLRTWTTRGPAWRVTDMGPHWVRVRDAVKAKTARSSDKATAEVSARFDQLVQHVALQLSGILGVDVQDSHRARADNASRCQQLADSGLLFGCLRYPALSTSSSSTQISAPTGSAHPSPSQRPAARPDHSRASTGWCGNCLTSPA